MAAEEQQPVLCGKLTGYGHAQRLSPRRHCDPQRLVVRVNVLKAGEYWLGHHNHACAAAEWVVVGVLVLGLGIVADIVKAYVQYALILCTAQYACIHRPRKHLGKYRKYINPQTAPPPQVHLRKAQYAYSPHPLLSAAS